MCCIHMAYDRPQWRRSCTRYSVFGFLTGGKFLDLLSDYKLLINYFSIMLVTSGSKNTTKITKKRGITVKFVIAN
jgi:hypothetical protein